MGSKVQPTGWWSSPGPPSSLWSGWPNVLGTGSFSAGVLGWDLRGPGTQQGVLWGSEVLPTGPSDTPG